MCSFISGNKRIASLNDFHCGYNLIIHIYSFKMEWFLPEIMNNVNRAVVFSLDFGRLGVFIGKFDLKTCIVNTYM